ncbi:OmpA family protein [Fulvivirga lutea]|uniref:OmpA family protein n=1 Tax=Fulvivirga lutea TaxID=2810512 RepID=A0A974WHQ7_9BACT|nr:OmpA family protein [Fulvivirga lutea]QSE97367.1 OmpA family protein [Fulvivirga lutea]
MNTFRKSLIVILFFTVTTALAQIPDNVKSYAVIGVFNLESNAQRFADFYATKGLKTSVRENNFNNLHYVYVHESSDVEEARSRVLSIREQFSALGKTWLYNGNFNCLHIPSDQLKQQNVASNSGGNDLEKLVHDVEEAELEREARQANMQNEMTEEMVAQNEEPVRVKPDDKFWVYFNTYDVTDLHEVKGSVKTTDIERQKDLGKLPTQELVEMDDPNNGTRKVNFETDIFGYRIVNRQVDLDEPETSKDKEHVTTIGDSIIVDMPLRRYNKGDYMTMWNVYFYIDAAIMREESITELNQLLNMMQENDNMRIAIHGHTNGNSHGVVKHLDLDDKKFFSLNGSHLETKASAKKLSEYRAYTIQHWLMDQGIEEDRMEIKGWGGKKMLYDKHSSSAEKNVRVEIEILEE